MKDQIQSSQPMAKGQNLRKLGVISRLKPRGPSRRQAQTYATMLEGKRQE